MAGERAVCIERVSTRRQTPGLQSPELAERVKGRGYDLQRTFTLSVSARKGKQQGVLDEILAGARRGDWQVVLTVAIDRIERRGVFALRQWITDLYRAGCRVESTSAGEEWLSDTRDELIWSIRLDLEADRARREAELRAERTARGHKRKDDLQQGRVKLPLGWRYEKRQKFDSQIVVDEPAMKVVREAFKLASEGATLQMISRAMKRLGYGRTPEMIGMMLRMRCYSTGTLLVPTAVSVDPAVRPEVQQQAIAALESRRRMTGPRNRHVEAADYAGRIFCYEHGAPLHRNFGPPHKDGSRRRYYRARVGHGECGCGMFDADVADEHVETLLGRLEEPETEMMVTGDSSARLAKIEQEKVMTFKRQADDWLQVLAALEAEKTALQNAAGGWERRETGRLLGDVWRSMNRAEQRRYLERQCETGNWRVVLRKEGRRRSGDLFAVMDSDHWVKGLREPVGPDDDLDDPLTERDGTFVTTAAPATAPTVTGTGDQSCIGGPAREYHVLTSAPPLAELATSWATALDAEGKSPATIKAYLQGARSYVTRYETSYPDAAPLLDAAGVRAFLADLRKAGQRPGTLRLRYSALRLFGKWPRPRVSMF